MGGIFRYFEWNLWGNKWSFSVCIAVVNEIFKDSYGCVHSLLGTTTLQALGKPIPKALVCLYFDVCCISVLHVLWLHSCGS